MKQSISNALQAAVAHHQAGRLPQAGGIYQQILQVAPNHPDALHLLGVVAHQLGKNDVAVELISKAISTNPSSQMHYNLGNALQALGKLDESVASYHKALSLKPDFAEALLSLGTALGAQGKLDAAVEAFQKANAILPNDMRALGNLGVTLQAQGKLNDALECFHTALSIQPDDAVAHNNLGNAFQEQGKLDEAVESFNRALAVRPNYPKAYSNLLFLHGYHHALLDPQAYLSLARGWELACLPEQDRQAARDRRFERLPLAGRRLRVGYVSGDFHQHAMSYFVEQLFTHHDRDRIELFAYSTHGHQDAVTLRLQSLVDHWIPLAGVPDALACERIEADRIDVLIDLSGHTANNRLGIFARRAAPVQAHYLGFFASTGLTEMDYWIGDEILIPPEANSHFSEQIWRLPRTWVSYEGKSGAPLPDWQPAQDATVWVGSFNNLNKLTPATLALWAKVLHALPNACLLLKAKQLADPDNRQRILNGMASHGISSERIELRDSGITPDWSDHMAYYNRLDIALDPVGGVGGGTTTCDALWMAVPVVTLIGDRMGSRMTASMLSAIGHPEWVACSEAEYVDKVVALAQNVALRKTLRLAQRGQMAASPLCDARNLAMNLEMAYLDMFELSINKQKNETFRTTL